MLHCREARLEFGYSAGAADATADALDREIGLEWCDAATRRM